MSDTTATVTDTRVRDTGAKADRKVDTFKAAAGGSGMSLAVGMGDWLILQCFAGGHWHWVPPSQTLVEMGSIIIMFPVCLWGYRVIGIIGQIIINRLQHDEGY